MAQEAAARAAAEADRLRDIVAMAREVADAETDLLGMLALAAKRTAEIVGTDGARVCLIEGDEVVCVAAHGTGASETHGCRVPLSMAFDADGRPRADLVVHDPDDPAEAEIAEQLRSTGVTSMACVPLLSRGQPSGLLCVVGAGRSDLDAVSVEALQLIAALLGDAVGRSADDLRVSAAASRLAVLADTSRGLAEAGADFESVLARCVDAGAALTGDCWVLRLVDPVEHRTIRLVVGDSDPTVREAVLAALGGTTGEVVGGLSGRAFDEGRAFHFGPDAISDGLAMTNPVLAPVMREAGATGIVVTPLLGRAGPVGSLAVFRHGSGLARGLAREPGHSPEEVSFVLDFGERIALAVDNARLLAQAEAELVERRRAEAALATQGSVLERIARGRPLHETLTELCLLVEAQTGGGLCSVLLHDPALAALRHAAAPSFSEELCRRLDGISVDMGVGACGEAAATRLPLVIEDILTHPNTQAFLDLAHDHGLAAVWSHPIIDPAGEVLGTFAVYRRHPHVPDQSERLLVEMAASLAGVAIDRLRAEQSIAHTAQHDPLTGLPNRALFLDRLGHALKRSRRRKGQVAVLFLDLDRFKLVNDSLGHATGDGLLIEAAARLQEMVRDGDTVARFGGDEFTVLCEDVRSHDEAQEVAERLGRVLAEPFVMRGGEFFLSASIGIAIGGGSGHAPVDPESLVGDADAAMYRAKDRGRARHELFDAGMRDETVARVSLEADLRRAVERDELVLHYQPVVDLGSGRIQGFEALVRWHHPEQGVLLPHHFVALAEETGLISGLGDWVIAAALRQAAEWAARGHTDLQVAVNVSARQLADPDLAGSILDQLAKAGVEPTALAVEITETAIMEDLDIARAVVETLTAVGVQFLIDDFGTGYSSIARLGGFRFAGVKVDRLFIATLADDASTRKVVGAVVELAHALGLSVVAEGVEQAQTVSILRTLGCDAAQGFHFGRPLSPAEATQLLERNPSW